MYHDYAEIALLGRDEPPFHALVVDEAQDLIGLRRLSVIDLLIRGGLGGGRWCMFGDFTRQALYNRDTRESRDPVMDLQAYGGRVVDGTRQRGLEFVKARLTRNCRNTRSIAEHTAMIAGFETPPFKPGAEVGIDVDYRYWGSSRRWQDLLTDTIEDLTKKHGVPVVDITVLTPGRAERDAIRSVERLGGHPLIDGASNLGVERVGIKVTTIHAFKGMESPVVVIPGIDRELEEWDPALLYVGMSRARSLLILIVHEKARDAVVRRIGTLKQGFKGHVPS